MKLELQIYLLVYINILNLVFADWVLIDTSFTSLSFSSSDDWKLHQDCYSFDKEKQFEVGECANSINQMNYANLKKDREYLKKSFNSRNF